MARLLVVSRSMALALRMADAHDVIEESIEALPDLPSDPSVEAIVLDVGEPSIAVQTLERLRAAGRDTPVLVVSGYQPAWAGLIAADLAGVLVVPLPITRSALLEGIDVLMSRTSPRPQPPEQGPASPDPGAARLAVVPVDARDGTRDGPGVSAGRQDDAAPGPGTDDTAPASADRDSERIDPPLPAGEAGTSLAGRSGRDPAPGNRGFDAVLRGTHDRAGHDPSDPAAGAQAAAGTGRRAAGRDPVPGSSADSSPRRSIAGDGAAAVTADGHRKDQESRSGDRAPDDRAADDRAADDRAADDRAADDHAADDHAPDDHAPDDHAPDDHAPDDHAPDDHAPDDHAPDDHAADDHAADDRAADETVPGDREASDPEPDVRGADDQAPDEATSDLMRPFIQPVVNAGGWSAPGFEWWDRDQQSDPVPPSGAPSGSSVAVQHDGPPTRPLRRGWPPASDAVAQIPHVGPGPGVDLSENGDDRETDPSPPIGGGLRISPALRVAIESAIKSHRSPSARADTPAVRSERSAHVPADSAAVVTEPVGVPRAAELTGHRRAPLASTPEAPTGARPQRRLGDLPRTGPGPAETSPEPIAVGRRLDDQDPPGQATPATDPIGEAPSAPQQHPPPVTHRPPGEQDDVQQARPDEEWTQEPGPAGGFRRRSAAPSPAERQIAQHLVLELTDRVGDLLGVADSALSLARDALERVGADAVAVLVPDGAVWRVSAGMALRAVERRLVLDASHWLIAQVARGGRSVTLVGSSSPASTEVARHQLGGAPLAEWRSVLAVPVPDVEAIVLLARGAESAPFGHDDLHAVDDLVAEASAVLRQALQIRHLARLLNPLREVDPAAR